MIMKNKNYIKKVIRDSLKEDVGVGDITSNILFNNKNFLVTADLVAKEEAILCGLDIFKEVFLQLSDLCVFDFQFKDGDLLKQNTIVGTITSPVKIMLAGERTGLNFLQRLSGISTLTHKFVSKSGRLNVYDTRKTTPLLRELEKYAVRIGGGRNHRFGLYDMVLIKDNHIYASMKEQGYINRIESIFNIVSKAKKEVENNYRIEVEVENFMEAKKAFEAGADIIMFDNAKVAELTEFIKFLGPKRGSVEIEWSGNVTLENIKSIKEFDIDRVSIGALTHSARAVDFSLKLRK